MFAYCLNNPVCRMDRGGTCSGILEHEDFGQASAKGGGGSFGIIVPIIIPIPSQPEPELSTSDVAAMEAFIAQKQEKAKEEAIAITITDVASGKRQEFFPANPLEFNPNGLVMKVYVDFGAGSNGTVIKWVLPGTKVAFFEWNEDCKNGAHYHVMLPLWNNQHLDPIHYKAGDPVPEPWNTMFFGGRR